MWLTELAPTTVFWYRDTIVLLLEEALVSIDVPSSVVQTFVWDDGRNQYVSVLRHYQSMSSDPRSDVWGLL